MPRLLTCGERQETRLEPGEMPGMPQSHLASCNGKLSQRNPEREKVKDYVHCPEGWNVGQGKNGDKPVVLIGPEPSALSDQRIWL